MQIRPSLPGPNGPSLSFAIDFSPTARNPEQRRGWAGHSSDRLDRLHEWLDLIRSYEHKSRTLGDRHASSLGSRASR